MSEANYLLFMISVVAAGAISAYLITGSLVAVVAVLIGVAGQCLVRAGKENDTDAEVSVS